MSRVAALVRGGVGGGERSGAVFRFEKKHYRLLENLALPGEGEGSVSWGAGVGVVPFVLGLDALAWPCLALHCVWVGLG